MARMECVWKPVSKSTSLLKRGSAYTSDMFSACFVLRDIHYIHSHAATGKGEKGTRPYSHRLSSTHACIFCQNLRLNRAVYVDGRKIHPHTTPSTDNPRRNKCLHNVPFIPVRNPYSPPHSQSSSFFLSSLSRWLQLPQLPYPSGIFALRDPRHPQKQCSPTPPLIFLISRPLSKNRLTLTCALILLTFPCTISDTQQNLTTPPSRARNPRNKCSNPCPP